MAMPADGAHCEIQYLTMKVYTVMSHRARSIRDIELVTVCFDKHFLLAVNA